MKWLNGSTTTSDILPREPPARRVFQEMQDAHEKRLNPTDLQIWMPPTTIASLALANRIHPSQRNQEPTLAQDQQRLHPAAQAMCPARSHSRVVPLLPTPNEGL